MIFDWHRSQKVQSSSHFTTYTECSGYIMAFMSLRKWVWVYTRSGLKTALGGARHKLIFSWQNWNCLGWGGATFLLRNQNLFAFLNKHQIFSIFLQQNPKIFDALRAFKLSRSAFFRQTVAYAWASGCWIPNGSLSTCRAYLFTTSCWVCSRAPLWQINFVQNVGTLRAIRTMEVVPPISVISTKVNYSCQS